MTDKKYTQISGDIDITPCLGDVKRLWVDWAPNEQCPHCGAQLPELGQIEYGFVSPYCNSCCEEIPWEYELEVSLKVFKVEKDE